MSPQTIRKLAHRWRRTACCVSLVVVAVVCLSEAQPRCVPYEAVYTAHYDPLEAREYHRFLPEPEGYNWYWTRQMQVGNPFYSDDETYEVALITEQSRGEDMGLISKAFLLVVSRRGTTLYKRDLFKLYDAEELGMNRSQSTYRVLPEYTDLVRPTEETLQGEPVSLMHGFMPTRARVKLVDLTGDGHPEVYLHLDRADNVVTYYVRIMGHDGSQLTPLLQAAGIRHGGAVAFGDSDGDGRCEVRFPYRVRFVGQGRAAWPADWVSTYERDGDRFGLDNAAFYASDTASLEENHRDHRNLTERFAVIKYEQYLEQHEFQIGMIYYYKDDFQQARHYLERVVEQGEDEQYVTTAKAVLAEMDADESESQPGSR